MLKSVSKAAFRVLSAETCLSTLKAAVQTAMTAPTGPVSVEIPIDIQQALIDMPADLSPLPVAVLAPARPRSTHWPSNWPRPGVRCCGWAAAPAMPALPCSA
jgi:thiamine pyrophosphate-dependent acetolactate synthase large subunit-like protein